MEWDEVGTDKPIRQGDLLVLRPTAPQESDAYVLVLTADCDIAQKKHGDAYAAVRILATDRYIQEEWSTNYLEVCRQKELDILINAFNKITNKTFGQSAIGSWIRRASLIEIVKTLKVSEKDEKKFIAICLQLKALIPDELNLETPSFELLIHYIAAKNNLSCEDATVKIIETARSKMGSLPTDLFLLTEIPDDLYSIKKPGFALLRGFIAISVDKVTTEATDARLNRKYLRIGRLKPIYKYGLTQQFGALYSRIGYPSEYDIKKAEILKSLSLDDYDE